MYAKKQIYVEFNTCLKAQNAGLFISRGEGIHPKRVISSTEIIFVEKGILGIREGLTNYKVSAGQSIILEPGIEHAGTVPYEPDLKYYWIHFDVIPAKGDDTETYVPHPPHNLLVIPKYREAARPTRIIQLFRWFLHDQEEGLLRPVTANLIVYHLLVEIGTHIPRGLQESSHWSHLLEIATTIIKTRFAENLGVGKIAGETGCNPDYLNRLFKKSFGTTISEYIKTRRLNHACTLLINSKDNIDSVAFRSGFNDPCYFRRCFRKKLGMTPKEYRGLYTRIHVNTE